MKRLGVFLILASSQLYASKYHWRFFNEFTDKSPKSIGEEEVSLEIEDWKCNIGNVSSSKRGETRRLGCGIKDGLQTYVLVTCEDDKADVQSLNLQMKKQSSIVLSLSCGKK